MSVLRLKVMNKLSVRSVGLAVILLPILLAACTSRYRLDLYLVEGATRTKVKVEKTEFLTGAVLGDPLSRDKVKPGDGNTLVLITGSRGRTLEAEAKDLISYDRYTRYRLFVQMQEAVQPGSIVLKDNSIVQKMGRYEIAAEDKLFYPTEGSLVVDSLSGKELFGSIEGRFENRHGEAVAFSGRFKARISR